MVYFLVKKREELPDSQGWRMSPKLDGFYLRLFAFP